MKEESHPTTSSFGIDCSKDELVIALIVMTVDHRCKVKATKTLKNTLSGYKQLISWINRKVIQDTSVRITIEATGNYHENVTLYLHNHGLFISVVLPNKSKRYMQSIGLRSKNDFIDAKGLAQMGAEQRLYQWKPFSEKIYELRTLTRYYEQLSHNQTALSNQFISLQNNMYQTELIPLKIKELINTIEEQKSEILEQITKLINSDPSLKERVDKIIKIKGLGLLTIATIIAETNGFALFENTRQLSSYAGYDIIENQSGKRTGRTKISKMGNSHIRRIMYMPSLTVIRCGEKPFTQLFDRVYTRTNIKMKAYVAIQRKLLCLIYTLWKNNAEYQPNYNDISGNDELKPLFPSKKNVGISRDLPTQDGLLYNDVAVSPLSVRQM